MNFDRDEFTEALKRLIDEFCPSSEGNERQKSFGDRKQLVLSILEKLDWGDLPSASPLETLDVDETNETPDTRYEKDTCGGTTVKGADDKQSDSLIALLDKRREPSVLVAITENKMESDRDGNANVDAYDVGSRKYRREEKQIVIWTDGVLWHFFLKNLGPENFDTFRSEENSFLRLDLKKDTGCGKAADKFEKLLLRENVLNGSTFEVAGWEFFAEKKLHDREEQEEDDYLLHPPIEFFVLADLRQVENESRKRLYDAVKQVADFEEIPAAPASPSDVPEKNLRSEYYGEVKTLESRPERTFTLDSTKYLHFKGTPALRHLAIELQYLSKKSEEVERSFLKEWEEYRPLGKDELPRATVAPEKLPRGTLKTKPQVRYSRLEVHRKLFPDDKTADGDEFKQETEKWWLYTSLGTDQIKKHMEDMCELAKKMGILEDFSIDFKDM